MKNEIHIDLDKIDIKAALSEAHDDVIANFPIDKVTATGETGNDLLNDLVNKVVEKYTEHLRGSLYVGFIRQSHVD